MTTEIDQKLSEMFELSAPTERRSPVVINQESDEESQIQTDIDHVRSNLYGLIGNGSEAIEKLMHLASESQHPRTYEVLSNFIKNMSDVGDKLVDLHKKKKELMGAEPAPTSANITVEKAVFVGSTSDLLKKIKEDPNVIDQ